MGEFRVGWCKARSEAGPTQAEQSCDALKDTLRMRASDEAMVGGQAWPDGVAVLVGLAVEI